MKKSTIFSMFIFVFVMLGLTACKMSIEPNRKTESSSLSIRFAQLGESKRTQQRAIVQGDGYLYLAAQAKAGQPADIYGPYQVKSGATFSTTALSVGSYNSLVLFYTSKNVVFTEKISVPELEREVSFKEIFENSYVIDYLGSWFLGEAVSDSTIENATDLTEALYSYFDGIASFGAVPAFTLASGETKEIACTLLPLVKTRLFVEEGEAAILNLNTTGASLSHRFIELSLPEGQDKKYNCTISSNQGDLYIGQIAMYNAKGKLIQNIKVDAIQNVPYEFSFLSQNQVRYLYFEYDKPINVSISVQEEVHNSLQITGLVDGFAQDFTGGSFYLLAVTDAEEYEADLYGPYEMQAGGIITATAIPEGEYDEIYALFSFKEIDPEERIGYTGYFFIQNALESYSFWEFYYPYAKTGNTDGAGSLFIETKDVLDPYLNSQAMIGQLKNVEVTSGTTSLNFSGKMTPIMSPNHSVENMASSGGFIVANIFEGEDTFIGFVKFEEDEWGNKVAPYRFNFNFEEDSVEDFKIFDEDMNLLPDLDTYTDDFYAFIIAGEDAFKGEEINGESTFGIEFELLLIRFVSNTGVEGNEHGYTIDDPMALTYALGEADIFLLVDDIEVSESISLGLQDITFKSADGEPKRIYPSQDLGNNPLFDIGWNSGSTSVLFENLIIGPEEKSNEETYSGALIKIGGSHSEHFKNITFKATKVTFENHIKDNGGTALSVEYADNATIELIDYIIDDCGVMYDDDPQTIGAVAITDSSDVNFILDYSQIKNCSGANGSAIRVVSVNNVGISLKNGSSIFNNNAFLSTVHLNGDTITLSIDETSSIKNNTGYGVYYYNSPLINNNGDISENTKGDIFSPDP